MAIIDIKVPDIGDFSEVAVIELLVKVGDTIKAEQSLVTVESDKASMEIPSSHAGVVKELKVKLGDKVAEGSVLLALEVQGAESAPGFLARARAQENQVFVVACNRVGEERGARYIGRSCIISPAGAHHADASDDQEHIIIAEIEPAEARNKKIVVRPGELEMDCFADRRPDLYGAG